MKKIITFFALILSCHFASAQEAGDIQTLVLKKGSIKSVTSSMKEFVDGPFARPEQKAPAWKEVDDHFICNDETCSSGCAAKGEMIINGFLVHRITAIAGERATRYTKGQTFVSLGCSAEEKQAVTSVYLQTLRSEENELNIINSGEAHAYLGMSGCFKIELLVAYNAKTNRILTSERSYIKNGDDMSCYNY